MVTSITIRVDPLTPAQVYEHLLNYEARLSHRNINMTFSLDFSINLTSKRFLLSRTVVREMLVTGAAIKGKDEAIMEVVNQPSSSTPRALPAKSI